jgi:hypothetical protein
MAGSASKSTAVAKVEAETQELELVTPSVDPALRGPSGPGGPGGPDPDRHEPRDRGPAGPRRPMPRSLIAALVVGVLVICSAIALNITTGALEKLNPFRNGVVQQRTIDRSGPVVLKAITDLGDFRAASGYYELVVDVEKDVKPVPSFLAGQRVLFIAAGTVEVGVDLRGLGAGSVVVDDARTSATITLPKPTLSEPSLDVERSYVYSQQRGLIDRLGDVFGDNAADQQKLYTLASQRLAEAAARTDELSTRGETNTRSMLQGLLKSLGFTDVTVNFTG